MSDFPDNITNPFGDLQESVFISPGINIREGGYDYYKPNYVDMLTFETIVNELKNEIDELKVNIEKLKNPEISKMRKDKIEKIFTEE
jgi:hypothetical protein